MTKVIGVRFRQASKIYFFAPGKLQIEKGDQVIVETARGVEFGNVVVGPKEVPDEEIMQPLKSVIRVATEEDKKYLDMKSFDMVVVVRSYTYLDDTSLFQYTESRHRPDKFKFVDFARRYK